MYSHGELKRLLRTTPEACGNPRGEMDGLMLRTLILLLYGAGLRLGEALALNVSDLDLEQSFLRVRQSKFYKSRLVPFGEDLTRVLRQYCRRLDRRYPSDPDSPVFRLRNGRRAHHKIVERTFRRLCRLAAVAREGGSRRQPRLHDLRHTAAVHRLIHWYRSGADPGARTRNQRLSAIHALARFIGERAPEHIEWCGQLRLISFKRTIEPAITCLGRAEMQALLATPKRSTPQGQRDYAMLLFLYNSGARVSEAAALTVADLDYYAHSVQILGKGNKWRTCPLWSATLDVLRALTVGRALAERVFPATDTPSPALVSTLS